MNHKGVFRTAPATPGLISCMISEFCGNLRPQNPLIMQEQNTIQPKRQIICSISIANIDSSVLAHITGALKPNVATKNCQMGDFVQNKGLDEDFILILWKQYFFMVSSVKRVFLFAMAIFQNICNFCYIVFLSCIISEFCGLKCLQNYLIMQEKIQYSPNGK